MKKISILLLSVCFLSGCEKQETKLLNGLKKFKQFHQDVCHCLLNSMPDFVSALNSDGHKNQNIFCFWQAHICSNQKTDEEIIASAKLMNRFGRFKCNDTNFTENFIKASSNINVNTMCNNMWSTDAVIYLQKMTHLTNTCYETFGKTQKVDCLCVVQQYVPIDDDCAKQL